MRIRAWRLVVLVSVLVILGMAGQAIAQDYRCPIGQPAAFKPGPEWVPTADCNGWVPPNHPLAKLPVIIDPVVPPVPVMAVQDIYSRIEWPNGSAVGSVTQIQGWALDCIMG